MKNYGIILEKLKKEDWLFAGKRDNITVEDWEKYLPDAEEQHGLYLETQACVTFSALNVLETIFNYQMQAGLIDTGWLNQNGYIIGGKVNFSDRFTAKMSGTTRRGNTGGRVADSIRHDGLVPEVLYPFPRIQRSPVFDWDDYYAEIPEELKELGKEFAKRFDIQYERVEVKNFKEALEHSPVQVYISTGCPRKNGVWQRCGKTINHAVMLYKIKDVYYTYDSYRLDGDFIRKLSLDYNFFRYGIKYIVKQNKSEDMLKLKIDKNKDQYLVDEKTKIAFTIADEKELETIKKHYKFDNPEPFDPLGYLVLHGGTEKRWREFLNINN